MKKWKVILMILLFAFFTSNVMAISINASQNQERQFARNIENTLYANDYSAYTIYVRKKMTDTMFKWNIINRDKTNPVTFQCPAFSPTNIEVKEKKVELDKQKIFKIYSIHSAIKKYDPDKPCVYFYQWVVDNKYKIHELLQQSYAIQDYPEHGAVVKSNSEDKFYWVNIMGIKNDKRLCVAFKNNNPLDSDIFSMLSEENMWKQLKSSKLNLDKTKLMVLDNFDILNNSWGFLFYDGNSEYYMSPNEYTYHQEIRLSEYIRPNEKNERTILPYTLYNVTDDLIPFLLKEYNLYITLEERAHAAG